VKAAYLLQFTTQPPQYELLDRVDDFQKQVLQSYQYSVFCKRRVCLKTNAFKIKFDDL